MMVWVFKDTPNNESYIDIVIFGSTGDNMEELGANHSADVTRGFGVRETNQMICSPKNQQILNWKWSFVANISERGFGYRRM